MRLCSFGGALVCRVALGAGATPSGPVSSAGRLLACFSDGAVEVVADVVFAQKGYS
jgi:hypothetical protein